MNLSNHIPDAGQMILLIDHPRLAFETPVGSLAEASAIYARMRDASGEGGSTFPEGAIFHDGVETHRISYNARVWRGHEWRGDMRDLAYDPRWGAAPDSPRGPAETPMAVYRGDRLGRGETPRNEKLVSVHRSTLAAMMEAERLARLDRAHTYTVGEAQPGLNATFCGSDGVPTQLVVETGAGPS